MVRDQPANPAEFSGTEAMAPGNPQQLEPELAGHILPLHVKMLRLATVEAGEEEAVRPGFPLIRGIPPTASPDRYRESAATPAPAPRHPPPAAPRSATAAAPSALAPAPGSPPAPPSPASPSWRLWRITRGCRRDWSAPSADRHRSGNRRAARRPPPRTPRRGDAASWR